MQILQEDLVKAGVLPANFNFEAHKELVPMQPGDVTTTYADTTALEHDFGFMGHRTKRLHRLTFALRLRQIRLRPWDDRFTHRGLHVYACGLFCLWAGKSFVYGRLARLWALYCNHPKYCQQNSA